MKIDFSKNGKKELMTAIQARYQSSRYIITKNISQYGSEYFRIVDTKYWYYIGSDEIYPIQITIRMSDHSASYYRRDRSYRVLNLDTNRTYSLENLERQLPKIFKEAQKNFMRCVFENEKNGVSNSWRVQNCYNNLRQYKHLSQYPEILEK